MSLVCPQCGTPIPAKNANIDTMIAKCEKCNTIFDFRHQLAAKPHTEREGTPPARVTMPIPEGITIEREDPDGGFAMAFRAHAGGVQPMTIRIRWFHPQQLVLLLVGIAFALGALVGIIVSIWVEAPLFAVLFPGIQFPVGLGIVYVAAAKLLNSTTIRLDTDRLSVRHGPLPWIGNQQFPVEQIAQLYVKERQTGNRGLTSVYDVHVTLRDRTSHRLLRSLPTAHKALYVEQEIERALGIGDKPVAGELPK